MAGMSNTLIDKIVNTTTPTGTSGAPGTYSAYAASAMKVRLNSTASTAAAAGTELTGSGYTAGGIAVPAASSASSGGAGVSLPATSALTWTNASGGAWSIVSFDLTDSAGARSWFGNFTGQPISVANGNSFTIAVAGITITAA
jgi:hypothetical protein